MAQNTRKIALDILTEVNEGGYFNLILKNKLRGLEGDDRRFVSALCYTTLENEVRLDYIIDLFTKGNRIHPLVRRVLRLGVCQLEFFESVPASAAVNESVKLLEHTGKRQLKGFVNAVLRRISENTGSIVYPSREKDPALYLSVMYSYPLWLAKKYIRDYGADFTEELFSFHKGDAETAIRVNRLLSSPEELENKLNGAGLAFRKGAYVRDIYYVRGIQNVDGMAAYKKGLMTVHSEASCLVVEAGTPRENESIMDCCAAPGGKSAYIAEAKPKYLLACDLHEHRVELMEANFNRLGVKAELRTADASVPQPDLYGCFDAVYVDAPCSALGLLYRKPDIKLNKTEEEIGSLPKIQKDILETASRYVKEGGRLIYSTCTINRMENDDVIDDFLMRHPDYKEGDLVSILPEKLMPRIRGGRLQLFPNIDGIDGFYIARLEKRKQD